MHYLGDVRSTIISGLIISRCRLCPVAYLKGIAMSSTRGKKLPKKYDGWKEPKIAISFLNNSHIYYGAVWGMIVTFLLFANH